MKNIITLFLIVFFFSAKAQLTTLINFNDTNGAGPNGSLYYDGTFLYGMTGGGGSYNLGTIFKIKPDGTGFDTLHNFKAQTGSSPRGSLISDGTFLYGTTGDGGGSSSCAFYGGCGSIFKIKPDGSGYLNIFNFDSLKGRNPYGDLYYDGTYLYGLTFRGGRNDNGTIFKIKPDGSSFDTLRCFDRYVNGGLPIGSLISDGTYLYGETPVGGYLDAGVIFKIKFDGSGLDTVLTFIGGPVGSSPRGSLIYDGIYLYGMACLGGPNSICNMGAGCGTIFKIKTNGTGFDTLSSFNLYNGGSPIGSLYYDGTALYGMTPKGGNIGGLCGNNGCGTSFKIQPNGTGYVDMYNFSDSIGSVPFGSLISDGTSLYGMTAGGGVYGKGIVFKLEKNSVVGINQNQVKNAYISIYPNPAFNSIELKLSTNSDFQNSSITIQNTLGQTVKKTSSVNKVDVSELPAGCYFLQLNMQNGEVFNCKFLKQ